ncbi:response regulator [Phenylobacterium sp. LH3H17]|uniref:response regulator n=1 Tax=Phenylobacterium sp. LH3H17 TaxID=2903901 RepID=UPI0020C9A7B4|nr:response regulator [Phenylobacterium sp. LH3H17]UTP40916.1 response regulator [Phenylobacterium sp. LH3H17]
MLIADDHPINRLVFQEMFRHLGCTVDVVEDGEQALLVAATACFDLICLDRHMPGFSGDEVAALLPSEQFVVAWSTDLMDLPARFNSVLSKPLTAESAVRVISMARAWRDEALGLVPPPAYPRLRRQAR